MYRQLPSRKLPLDADIGSRLEKDTPVHLQYCIPYWNEISNAKACSTSCKALQVLGYDVPSICCSCQEITNNQVSLVKCGNKLRIKFMFLVPIHLPSAQWTEIRGISENERNTILNYWGISENEHCTSDSPGFYKKRESIPVSYPFEFHLIFTSMHNVLQSYWM
uniref:Uncharacterized protein n=1 Tax=Arundo donax TaxID=35708 RepID=A0A0A9D0E1_ARUDO